MTTSHPPIAIEVVAADLPLKRPFRISGYVFTSTPVVRVSALRGGVRGRGEAAGVYYMEDTPAKAAAAVAAFGGALPEGITREALRELLPAGGARNALDCALWELEALEAGRPVWALAGLPPPRPLLTTVTLGADDPEVMVEGARAHGFARALKLKLSGQSVEDIERVRAVRAARPDVWLGVDANQGYAPDTIGALVPVLADCGVALLEQPFRRGAEADLDGLDLGVPVAADESCLDLSELPALVGRFDVVNIKLDKCGGLTEGLMIAAQAQALGLKVMVGNMTGSSLAMAPAFVLGQLCALVDLDGPLFLEADPPPCVTYEGGQITCPPGVWGPG